MKFQILISTLVVYTTFAFAPSSVTSFGNRKINSALAMSSKIIDMSNIETADDDGPLSDGINPKAMGVTIVKEITYPQDIAESKSVPKITEPKIFAFKGSSKVEKHSHPGSGQYFVTDGKITVTTDSEKKTYEKGDMFIIPKDVEYELEHLEEEGEATIFYVYWSAERPD